MTAIVRMRPAEYARHRSVSRAAIGKAIDTGRVPADTIETDAAGIKWIDVAAADLAWPHGNVRINSAPDLAGNFSTSSSVPEENAAAAPRETPALTQARTDSARIETRLKELQLAKLLGETVDAADVTRSMERACEMLGRDVDQLHTRADDLVTAYTRGGVTAVRALLKEISRSIRQTIASNMTLLAAEDDEPADDDADVIDLAETTKQDAAA